MCACAKRQHSSQCYAHTGLPKVGRMHANHKQGITMQWESSAVDVQNTNLRKQLAPLLPIVDVTDIACTSLSQNRCSSEAKVVTGYFTSVGQEKETKT